MTKKFFAGLLLMFLLIPNLAFASFENEEIEKIAPINVELGTVEFFKGNMLKEQSLKIEGDTNIFLKENIQQDLKMSEVNNFGIKRSLSSINDEPNTAYLVNIDGVYADYITEKDQVKWYAFESVNQGKLTVFLQTISSDTIDYDLHLFKLNEDTMTLEEQKTSNYPAGFNEQVARVADGGIYYIAVSTSSGFDTNQPFLFTIKYSAVYDNNEIDDNVWLAKSYTNTVNHVGTIDNSFDEDWIAISLTEAKTLYTRLNNTANSNYQLDIFDQNLNHLAGFNQNKNYNNYAFSPGTYYLRITSSSSFDAATNYQLIMNDAHGVAYKSKVTNIDSDGGVAGRVDYGWGRAWRIKHNITIQGTLVDQNNKVVPYTNVKFYILGDLNDKLYQEETITDVNGNYSLDMSIGHSTGKYSFGAPVSIHYFDVIPMQAHSNGTLLQMDDNKLYHFAYSMPY